MIHVWCVNLNNDSMNIFIDNGINLLNQSIVKLVCLHSHHQSSLSRITVTDREMELVDCAVVARFRLEWWRHWFVVKGERNGWLRDIDEWIRFCDILLWSILSFKWSFVMLIGKFKRNWTILCWEQFYANDILDYHWNSNFYGSFEQTMRINTWLIHSLRRIRSSVLRSYSLVGKRMKVFEWNSCSYRSSSSYLLLPKLRNFVKSRECNTRKSS